MDTKNLIDAIYKKASYEKSEIEKQRQKKSDEFVAKLEKIKSNMKRIQDMFLIAQALLDNDVNLGKVRKDSCGFVHYEFETDGVFHTLGFKVECVDKHRIVKGIGIEGGGCDGYDFYVYTNGTFNIDVNKRYHNDSRVGYPFEVWTIYTKVDYFIKEFDDFEKRFLNFVESYV